jgi:hypothetical protein
MGDLGELMEQRVSVEEKGTAEAADDGVEQDTESP